MAVAVATTYFVVANLHNVVSVFGRTTNAARNPLINKTARDADEEWKKKGQSLRDTLPDRSNTTPSEWHIVQHAHPGGQSYGGCHSYWLTEGS